MSADSEGTKVGEKSKKTEIASLAWPKTNTKQQPTTKQLAYNQTRTKQSQVVEERPQTIIPLAKTKPAMFILLTGAAAEEKRKIAEKVGVVYPGHGSPTV